MICCFFKQKTAYEMRISDWSSDVCSSDLALHAVLIDVAETRALPAAEGVVGDRHRDRHVDADHADVDAGGEFARGMAVARENRDAVAILMARGQRQRFLEIRSEEHTSELQSLMRTSYAVFCLQKKHRNHTHSRHTTAL